MSNIFGPGHKWNTLLASDALALTVDYLREPHRRIVRTLENVEIDSTRLTRSLTFEFDAPLIPHLFPVLNVPIGALIDTLHVADETHVLPFTLGRSDAIRVTYLALSSSISQQAAMVSNQLQEGDLDSPAGRLMRDLVRVLPSMAAGTPDELAELGSLLFRARRIALSERSTGSPLAIFRDNHLWRMFRLCLSDRFVYVPVFPDTPAPAESTRLKVGVTYEQDLNSSASPNFRTAFRLATGHAADDYLVALKGAGRSRSYHFRLRGEPGSYVRKATRLAAAGEPLLTDGNSIRLKNLKPVITRDEDDADQVPPNFDTSRGQSDAAVEKPQRGVDNLAHIYVSTTGLSVGRTGAQAVQFARVVFRERPAGYSASVAVRALTALGVVSTVGIGAETILAAGTGVSIPVSAFFAVPALLALNQRFEHLSFAIANLTAYLALLISVACGMIYLFWAATTNKPTWTLVLYQGFNVILAASLLVLVGCSLWNAYAYWRKRSRVAH